MSQERRVAVQREADPIARLRAMVEALPPGPHRVSEYGYAGDVPEEIAADVPSLYTAYSSDSDMMSLPTAETVAALVTLAPELLAVVEAGERRQRASVGYACGEVDVIEYGAAGAALSDTLDALRTRAAEVTP